MLFIGLKKVEVTKDIEKNILVMCEDKNLTVINLRENGETN